MLTSAMLWVLIIGGLLIAESAVVTWGNVARARALADASRRALPEPQKEKR